MVNLYYLKYFIDACESGSLAKAAQMNRVTSSAISQSIKWLEDYYQVELVEHGKNKFIMTQKGELFVKKAKSMLHEFKTFDNDIKKMGDNFRYVLTISMQQSIANMAGSKAIKTFSEKYPEVDLKVVIGTSHHCAELMKKGEVEYSVSIENVHFEAKKIKLYSGKFVFISAANDIRSSHEAGFIVTGDTRESLDIQGLYFKKYKKQMPINFAVASWGVISNMAINGNGAAYIPDYYLREIDKSRYKICRLDLKTSRYNINFYYGKKAQYTFYHKAFVEELSTFLK